MTQPVQHHLRDGTATVDALARGLVIDRLGETGHRAFAILVRYSQDRNIKLRDVAERLIDSRELP